MMKISDCVEVTGAITATKFSNIYYGGNQKWVYKDDSDVLGNLASTYFIHDGDFILQVVPLFSARILGVRERFKALMIYILDKEGNKIDEQVYLATGDEPGKTLVKYTVKQ